MGAGPDATLRSPCARRRRCGTTVRGGELADPDAQVEIPFAAIDPKLSEAQLERLRGYGSAQDVAAGDILYGPGDAGYDLVIVDDAVVEILQPATRDGPEEGLIRFGPGSCAGELNMLTGQVVSLIARVVEGGHVHRIPPDRFRRLMGEDPELSNLLLETFRARRAALTENAASRGIEIVGSRMDARSLALRTYAARRRLPHRWFDADSVAGRTLMEVASLTAADLPAVALGDRILRRATPGELGSALGLTYRPRDDGEVV